MKNYGSRVKIKIGHTQCTLTFDSNDKIDSNKISSYVKIYASFIYMSEIFMINKLL